MATKSFAMHSQSKMTVEEMTRQVNEDYKEIVSRLGRTSPIIGSCRMDIDKEKSDCRDIEESWKDIRKEKDRKYSHYEIGHRFVAEHLVASINGKIGLSSDEERTLREFIGRVHYNPPTAETLRRAKAAEDMAEYGEERSAQIFDALKAECRSLRASIYEQSHTKVKEIEDMFFNPLEIYPGFLTVCQNFGDVASLMRKLARLVDEKGCAPFYGS